MKTVSPFGSWKSPITPEFVAGKDRNLAGSLRADGDILYFLEARPDEGGRQVLMRLGPDGKVSEALRGSFNIRTRYLEYGGSCLLVDQGKIFFVHFDDQQVYGGKAGEIPVPVTKEPLSRFSDLVLDEKRNRLLALREVQGKPESVNTICAIDLATGEVSDIVSGEDFYLCPRLDESRDKLLWISWNHPNMAWNGTELWMAELDGEGQPKEAVKIVGDENHGVCQASWCGKDILFVAELEGWFNLFRFREGKIENLDPREAEFAFPAWVPGNEQYGAMGDMILASFLSLGVARFCLIREGKTRTLPQKFSAIYDVAAGEESFFALVGFPQKPPAIVRVSPQGDISEIYSSQGFRLSAEAISLPQPVQFPVAEGGEGHAWVYAPKNEHFRAPEGEKPPLIVICHGGPTSMSSGDFRKSVQFWTSRGYAVVDVNYAGSTGYGRRYRERLRGNWGKVDVSDCVSVVRHLASEGKIDPERVAIRGGSAGGYTTLAVLTFTKGVISVGASYFGVSELELLAKETHKLESRYLDQLVGQFPEAIETYKARSPLVHVDNLNCPVIFFQGDEDRVVPPNQSELMHESLRKKGIYSEYHLYPGEGHGFRRAETVQHSLKAEHAFYAKAFGFPVQPEDRA